MVKITKKYLFITEGSCDEQTIFEKILIKYGFNVVSNNVFVGQDGLQQVELSSNKDNVIIIQGPRNRISDFLKHYNKNQEDLESFFNFCKNEFQGIFLIYDVDHNSEQEIVDMFNMFNDESSGMLLLSSPCLEVLGDFDKTRNFLMYHHLSEYKHELNKHYDLDLATNTIDYIVDHFEELVVFYLDKNRNEFNENNIMEHPGLIIPLINKYNERINLDNKEESYVIYRYFTTVLYVAIAYINSLTIEIDNYQIVKDFFLSKKQ